MIVIMAAGKGSRWKSSRGIDTWYDQTGTPKQMATINGEAIIHRILRLIGDRDYIITVPIGQRLPIVAKQVEYESTMEIDRFYPISSHVTYLYGDVYYTEQAMDTILNGKDGFYGRTEPVQGCKTVKELFAVKGCGVEIQKHVQIVREALISGECKRGIGWDLYKSFYAMDWMPERMSFMACKFVNPINDGTDDIDRLADLDRLKKRFEI